MPVEQNLELIRHGKCSTTARGNTFSARKREEKGKDYLKTATGQGPLGYSPDGRFRAGGKRLQRWVMTSSLF